MRTWLITILWFASGLICATASAKNLGVRPTTNVVALSEHIFGCATVAEKSEIAALGRSKIIEVLRQHGVRVAKENEPGHKDDVMAEMAVHIHTFCQNGDMIYSIFVDAEQPNYPRAVWDYPFWSGRAPRKEIAESVAQGLDHILFIHIRYILLR